MTEAYLDCKADFPALSKEIAKSIADDLFKPSDFKFDFKLR